ncbi:MAG: hypothetical protein INR63_06665, partial [Actinomycetospora chiangmaiensis]|nr:hypothetical protein [Actinomycetospora chiangmaiensis]
MLDDRARAPSLHLGQRTTAAAIPAEPRDWVAEFRREQAHLIKPAPRPGASRILAYGLGAALAVALAAGL